jgi:hypothetical protein
MSKVGNGFIFRIQRTNTTVDVDSADVKFNETFSDCVDRKGREIKGGRVLQPDLINELDMAADIKRAMETWAAKSNSSSRFSSTNRYEKLSEKDNDEEASDKDENNSDEESNKENDNDPEDSDEENDGDSHEQYDPQDQEQQRPQKPFEEKRQSRPITMKEKKSREIKGLSSSTGFRTEIKTKSVSQSEQRKSKRAVKSRERYQPNFEPTYKRKDATLLIEEEDDDLTDLDLNEQIFGQLLSCMEQNIGKESGKLNDPEENLMKNLQDIGNPDPKSQKAIDKMPEQARKRYNDATKKEFDGMKSKGVMEFVRMTDIPKDAKIYICIVNWVTKYVLGVYQKTKCRICFGGHHYVKTFTDCFAPTVSFCSVLIMMCLSLSDVWVAHWEFGLCTGLP